MHVRNKLSTISPAEAVSNQEPDFPSASSTNADADHNLSMEISPVRKTGGSEKMHCVSSV